MACAEEKWIKPNGQLPGLHRTDAWRPNCAPAPPDTLACVAWQVLRNFPSIIDVLPGLCSSAAYLSFEHRLDDNEDLEWRIDSMRMNAVRR